MMKHIFGSVKVAFLALLMMGFSLAAQAEDYAASVTTNGVTTSYLTLTDAWTVATNAQHKSINAYVMLLTNVTVESTLKTSDNGELTLDLNDHVLAYAGASDSYLIWQWAGTLNLIDSATKRTPRYFVREGSGLWTLTNEKTDLVIEGGLLTGGRAGAVYYNYQSTHSISNVNIVGNSSALNGGGLTTLYTGVKLKIAASTFMGNVAAGDGGAISSLGLCEMTDCRVEKNVAGGLGGGLYLRFQGSLVRTEVVDNKAGTGGGVYLVFSPSCFPAGVRIRLADGSEKNVEDVVKGDVVATYDHIGGTNSSAVVYYVYRGKKSQDVFTLSFASGSTLDIADRHDLLLESTRKYVTVSSENARLYLGKRFYNYTTGGWDELTGVSAEKACESHYSIYTRDHANCVANGMLTVPDDKDCFVNIYELDENLKASAAQLAADIESYGLASPADYPNVPLCNFIDGNIRYAFIAIGKGLTTQEELLFWNEFDYGPVKKFGVSLAAATLYATPLIPYLSVGEGAVVTGNVTAASKPSNVYFLCNDWPPVIEILPGASDLDIGITLSSTNGVFGWTNDVNYASCFASDNPDCSVSYTADKTLDLVPFVAVEPVEVDHTTAEVYYGETKLSGEPFLVPSNATPVRVVYVADTDYFYADGTTVKTNLVDTSTNPATVTGEIPTAPVKAIKYLEPIYVGGIATNGIDHWVTNTCTTYTTVSSSAGPMGVPWGETGKTTWYVVAEPGLEIAPYAKCFGQVNLILCDGASLTVTGGVGRDPNASLTIFSEPNGTGELFTTNTSNGAGIGSRNITINGGRITAIGNEGGAGIGGDRSSATSNIVINGGIVKATGSGDSSTGGGAGIGGGAYSGAENITINGGTVTATGGACSAGIGGGWGGSCSNLVIRGGTIVATGMKFGAGIGGGQSGTGSNIIISGGEVLATGGDSAAGIGGGVNVAGFDISIFGGKVTAIGGKSASGIGGGYGFMGSGTRITIDSGIVTALGGVYGAAIGGGHRASASKIAIGGDAKVFVATAPSVRDGVSMVADLIGCGYEATETADEMTLAPTAQILFNLTGFYGDVGQEWLEDISPMPSDFDGFVILTPATQTLDRVLVGGIGETGAAGLSTFGLTNAVTGAIGAVTVDVDETTFAHSFFRLSTAAGDLKVKIRPPALTISQQPNATNTYSIVSSTDGNNGITNYAWCVQTESTTGFVVLTNALVDGAELGMTAYGDIEGTVITSDDNDGHIMNLVWWPSDNEYGFAGIPKGGKLFFSCSADLTCDYEEYVGSIRRIGATDEWVWEAKLYDVTEGEGLFAYALMLTADTSFTINNLRWVSAECEIVAQGPTMTQFPTDFGVIGSKYLCRMDYGHEGIFYKGDGEVFEYLGAIQVGDNAWADVKGDVCTVSGTGPMWNADGWPGGVNPLQSYRNAISNLTVRAGVTSVGSQFFENWWSLCQVSLGADVSTIGARVFHKCYNITNVQIAATSPVYVSDYAFLRCYSLAHLVFAGQNVTFGTDAYTMHAAIHIKDGMPEVYSVPTISISGMKQILKGKKLLTDPNWTTITTPEERAQNRFFILTLEKE